MKFKEIGDEMGYSYYDEKLDMPLDFFEYLLSENIAPKQTLYGTDGENLQWNEKSWGDGSKSYWTFLNSDRRTYIVLIEKKNIMFITADSIIDLTRDYSYNETKKLFSFDKRDTGSILDFFNKLFYVLINGIKKYKIDIIYFNGVDDKLDKTYRTIVSNKRFISELEKTGLKYMGFINNKYVFSNKDQI